jgi:hypothetical protein
MPVMVVPVRDGVAEGQHCLQVVDLVEWPASLVAAGLSAETVNKQGAYRFETGSLAADIVAAADQLVRRHLSCLGVEEVPELGLQRMGATALPKRGDSA